MNPHLKEKTFKLKTVYEVSIWAKQVSADSHYGFSTAQVSS